MTAFFQSGTKPTESSWLNTRANGPLRLSLNCLNRTGDRSSGSQLSLHLTLSVADIYNTIQILWKRNTVTVWYTTMLLSTLSTNEKYLSWWVTMSIKLAIAGSDSADSRTIGNTLINLADKLVFSVLATQ